MAALLFELEDALLTKPNESKMTPFEERLIQTYKTKALGDALSVGTVSAVLACADIPATAEEQSKQLVTSDTTTRRFAWGHRLNISLGSFLLSGTWRMQRSSNAYVDTMLGIEGSRVQEELAKLILTRHAQNTSMVKLLSKYYYPEEVLNDLNPDKHFLVWRLRNRHTDNTRTSDALDNSSSKKADTQPSRSTISRSQGEDMVADPLDCIFGYPENKEISLADERGPPKRRLHARRRRNRHYQGRHGEHNDDIEIALANS